MGAQITQVVKWPLPGQFVDMTHDWCRWIQRRQVTVEEYFVVILGQGGTQFRGAPDCDVPVLGVGGDGL